MLKFETDRRGNQEGSHPKYYSCLSFKAGFNRSIYREEKSIITQKRAYKWRPTMRTDIARVPCVPCAVRSQCSWTRQRGVTDSWFADRVGVNRYDWQIITKTHERQSARRSTPDHYTATAHWLTRRTTCLRYFEIQKSDCDFQPRHSHFGVRLSMSCFWTSYLYG